MLSEMKSVSPYAVTHCPPLAPLIFANVQSVENHERSHFLPESSRRSSRAFLEPRQTLGLNMVHMVAKKRVNPLDAFARLTKNYGYVLRKSWRKRVDVARGIGADRACGSDPTRETSHVSPPRALRFSFSFLLSSILLLVFTRRCTPR